MVRKQRKLKYYQLSMIDTKNEAVLDCPDTEVRFNEIVNKNMIPIIGTSHKVVQIELSDGSYFIEFIKQDNHVWYIKLGVANPTNSIAIRDKGTLESNSLEIDPTKSLEINTRQRRHMAPIAISFKTNMWMPSISPHPIISTTKR